MVSGGLILTHFSKLKLTHLYLLLGYLNGYLLTLRPLYHMA